MSGPMQGIKVVEMGVWVAGPSCAAILCDWGADVVKIEPPNGDPFRGLFANALGAAIPVNPPFEVDNRGKRSVALNLEHEDGRAIARRLLDEADVFVTNMRPRVCEQFGFGYEELRKTNPRMIYAQLTGQGPDGPDANRAAYDIGGFWSRAGVGASLTPAGQPIPQQRGGMGDHMTGLAAAGAISAALFHRERTGEGQRVAASLVRTGVYMMAWDYALELRMGVKTTPYDRFHAPNPIINCFQTKDGRWLWLLLLQGDRHWPDLIRALGREDLRDDPRFANIMLRRDNAPALVEELDSEFGKRTLEEWGQILDRNNVWWAPVNTITQAIQDPVVQGAGALTKVEGPDGDIPLVATPVDFYGTPAAARGPSPELGQHTEEVLLEMGFDWDKIIALKEAGAIP
ncbi:MAG TPA: CoA transferase [Dehalococcoidia bacterium]|nr:CoA transferase [Dehalococcoidia bacterium]